jgi:hypothetical protein
MCTSVCNINIPSLLVEGSAVGYVIGTVKGSINSFCIDGNVDGNGNYNGIINGYVNGIVTGHIKGYASVNGARYALVDQDVKNANISCFNLLT